MLEHPGYIKSGSIAWTLSAGSWKAGFSAEAADSPVLELGSLEEKEWRHIRGREISMIFQNPVQALNHSRTIRSQFIEAIRAHHRHAGKRECIALAETALEDAMLSESGKILNSYPFELSGGMCQRVMIALALIHRPTLLIADEPTTALDTKNQTGILELLARVRELYHTAILLVSHDEKVISEITDRKISLL
ncbi:glutathione import ATP-binding protein GsiA [Treponema primitia ZAS-2]|uniref:Glutathione import ATP-binding protein GsiA n=2 Tax=Treponema primitia TaxID=88058 RepID=F5YKC0_TREPZ|nr:glutathione import ATP-binding protein GsiA [Treponema primitia ZAS-2]